MSHKMCQNSTVRLKNKVLIQNLWVSMNNSIEQWQSLRSCYLSNLRLACYEILVGYEGRVDWRVELFGDL